MLAEVKISAVGNPLELAKAGVSEREFVFDIRGAGPLLGVVGEFVLVVLAELEVGGAVRPIDCHHLQAGVAPRTCTTHERYRGG